MSLANLSLTDLAGTILGFILTLMIFSYIFGDNALFRVALYLFIGSASGYAAVVAWYNVIWPQLVIPAIYGSFDERMLVIFPLLMSALVLFKISPRLSSFGNPAVAYLLGVGMAAAVAGAILGTILPQSQASMNLFDVSSISPGEDTVFQLAKGSAILLGVFTTLIYFHFGAHQTLGQAPSRPKWLGALAWVGQIFIAITLGAMFAGVYSAA
jgi:hypothetical protein